MAINQTASLCQNVRHDIVAAMHSNEPNRSYILVSLVHVALVSWWYRALKIILIFQWRRGDLWSGNHPFFVWRSGWWGDPILLDKLCSVHGVKVNGRVWWRWWDFKTQKRFGDQERISMKLHHELGLWFGNRYHRIHHSLAIYFQYLLFSHVLCFCDL